MRWSPPSERTQLWLLSPILVPACVVAIPFVAAMAGGLAVSDWWARRQKYDEWHRWFAWRPVCLDWWGDEENGGKWVWLEYVERRRFFSGCVQYRSRALARIEAFGGDTEEWLHREATKAGIAPKNSHIQGEGR